MENNKPKIVTGNFEAEYNIHRGWVAGHFLDPSSPLCTSDLEIKWARHKKGEKKDLVAFNQTSKTLFILFSGRFKFIFPESDEEIIAKEEGDYVFFDAQVPHSWEVLEDCLAVSIRWPSIPHDQIASE